MMTQNDEFMRAPRHSDNASESVTGDEIIRQIQQLITDQSFGVLCTQRDQQPYGSLIAYAVSDDYRFFYFSTPRATRKYRLLTACSNVALFVDSRNRFPDDLFKVEAATITGQAAELRSENESHIARERLTARHPDIAHFYQSDATALFRISVTQYVHVARFQDVSQWIP